VTSACGSGGARPTILLLDGRAIFDVEYAALEQSSFGRTLGHGRMFPDMQAAVDRFQQWSWS
jgi:hypothetical protein